MGPSLQSKWNALAARPNADFTWCKHAETCFYITCFCTQNCALFTKSATDSCSITLRSLTNELYRISCSRYFISLVLLRRLRLACIREMAASESVMASHNSSDMLAKLSRMEKSYIHHVNATAAVVNSLPAFDFFVKKAVRSQRTNI